jgi:hypothetical protein
MRKNGFVLAMLALALTFTAALAAGCGKQDSGGGKYYAAQKLFAFQENL